jgi:protein TonB
MRFLTAFVGALLITVTVFIFMQTLIENQHDRDQSVPVFEPIQIIQPKPTRQEPEQKQVEQTTPEPVMQSLQVPFPTPKPLVEMQLPELDLNAGDFDVRHGPSRWSAPLGTDAITIIEGNGNNAQAYVEVVPIGTRMPNVPELAWKNKIDGWVLVVFNVLPSGKTANIRVLDASPRGIFEEKVIAAVEDWLYSVKYFGELDGKIVLTQKVDIEWKSYPRNFLSLDN